MSDGFVEETQRRLADAERELERLESEAHALRSKVADARQTVKAYRHVLEIAQDVSMGPPPPDARSAAAVLGSLGGAKGGLARAESLSPERRTEIAREAAKARWGGAEKP